MKKLLLSFLVITMISLVGYTQITGVVYGVDQTGKKTLLPAANIYWSDRQVGVVSNMQGEFSISEPPAGVSIIISYVGYKSDTLSTFNKSKKTEIILKESSFINQVDIVENRSGSHLDRMNPLWKQEIGSGELAACCML